jgi:DNA-binding NtrC family response regulator
VYKVGFIDDERNLIEMYSVRLKRKGIDLIFADANQSKEDVVKWILDNGVKCMLVDYKLTEAYDYNGTALVAHINSELPDLPCIILTSYRDGGIGENLVIQNLIIEREVLDKDFDSREFEELVGMCKQAVEVFDNRLQLRQSEFGRLKLKKEKNSITAIEEERFIEMYKLLRAYDIVDDIPAELLTTNINQKMSDILDSLDRLIERT